MTGRVVHVEIPFDDGDRLLFCVRQTTRRT